MKTLRMVMRDFSLGAALCLLTAALLFSQVRVDPATQADFPGVTADDKVQNMRIAMLDYNQQKIMTQQELLAGQLNTVNLELSKLGTIGYVLIFSLLLLLAIQLLQAFFLFHFARKRKYVEDDDVTP